MGVQKLAVIVVGSLLLACCGDGFDQNSGGLSYAALPDPGVDWVPLVQQLQQDGSCGPATKILLEGALQMDEGVSLLLDEQAALTSCNTANAENRELLQRLLADFSSSDTSNAHARLEDWRNQENIPLARLLLDTSPSAVGSSSINDLAPLEADWISHCEGPLRMHAGNPYRMRQAIASATGDASYLLPEWEQRRQECLAQGGELLSSYEALRDSETMDSGRAYLNQVISAFTPYLARLEQS